MTDAPDRGMRLPFRILWFAGYHLVLWWALVSALNATSGRPAFILFLLGFALAVGLVLQASAKLPAAYHGLALLVFLPGLLFLGPATLTGAYRGAAMPTQQVTVLSATSHQVSGIYASLSGLRVHSYTDVKVRLADGSTERGIVRPERQLAPGQTLRLHVDPLGLVKPQAVSGGPSGALVAVTLLVLVLAEVELISALVRPAGGSFIAASGREVAAKDAASAGSAPPGRAAGSA